MVHDRLSNLESRLLASLHEYRIQEYQLLPYKIKLTMPWETASAKRYYRHGMLVKLIINESLSVTGECAPMPEIGTESLEQAQNALENKLASWHGKPITAELLQDMENFPASRFALETALLALRQKQTGQTIAQMLNPKYSPTIITNIMLGKLDEQLLYKAQQAQADGFSCLKIKLGLKDIESETQSLLQVLQQLSPSTQIRLDANKSWSYEQSKWFLNTLKVHLKDDLNRIDSIEEPLSDFNIQEYQALQNHTRIALALDESFCDKISLKHYPVRRLVLKPTAQGGIIKTWQLARLAKRYNIETIITSSIETAYGLWPISYLCAALGSSQTHGLATASWLEDTLITAPEVKHGIIII